jgi:hypothetical protein
LNATNCVADGSMLVTQIRHRLDQMAAQVLAAE